MKINIEFIRSIVEPVMGNRSLRAIAVIFGLGLALTSCVTPPQGPVADPRRFNELSPGISTEADALRVLGPAMSYSAIQQGQTLLQWYDMYHRPAIHLAILFDASGKMERVQSATIIP